MADDIIVEDRIMKRVRRIHLLRKVFHPAAMKSYAAAVLAAIGFSLVSVSSVFKNALTAPDPQAAAHFATNAMVHTEPIVQVVIAAVLALGIFLLRDIVKLSRKEGNARFA